MMNHLRGKHPESDILDKLSAHAKDMTHRRLLCVICNTIYAHKTPFSMNDAMIDMFVRKMKSDTTKCDMCKRTAWNKGLNKNSNAILLKMSQERQGVGNPIHSVMSNPQKYAKWKEKLAASGIERGKKRKDKSYEEQYGKEKAESVKTKLSEKRRQRSIEPRLGKFHTEETKQKISEKVAKYLSESKLRVSKPQQRLFDLLNAMKLSEQPVLEHRVGYYVVDIAFPDKRIAVEVDGDFFHVNESAGYSVKSQIQVRTKNNDAKKNSYLKNRGWQLIRIWTSDIDKCIDACLKQVVKYVG